MAQGVCEICLSEGVTQEHHIISRAIIGRIKTGEHGSDLDLMNNPRNLIPRRGRPLASACARVGVRPAPRRGAGLARRPLRGRRALVRCE